MDNKQQPQSSSSSGNGFFSSFGNNFAATAGGGLANNLMSLLFSGYRERAALRYQKKLNQIMNDSQLDFNKRNAETLSPSFYRQLYEDANISPEKLYSPGASGGPSGGTSKPNPGGMPDLFSHSSGSPVSPDQSSLIQSQASLNDAQAEYWKNKSITESGMPSYYQAIEKLNETLTDVEVFLKNSKRNQIDSAANKDSSTAAYYTALASLTGTQDGIAKLQYKALKQDYTFSYYGASGVRATMTTKGYLLPTLIGITTFVGNMQENSLTANTAPTIVKQTKQALTNLFQQGRLLKSQADISDVVAGLERATRDFKYWQEHYRTDIMQLNRNYQQWINDTAEDQRRFENFQKNAHLVLDALGLAFQGYSIGNTATYYDRMYDVQQRKLSEQRYQFDHRDPKPIGKTRVYRKNGYTEINEY